MVFPRFRNHHHDGFGDGPPSEPQQFCHFIEGGRVRGAGGTDGKQLLRGVPQQGVCQGGLPGAHPVPVSLDGIDFAIVGDGTERLRQRPRREGVGGEP